MSVVMKSFERLVLAYLKDITGTLLDLLQFTYWANRSVDDAVDLGLLCVLQHLDSPSARILFVDLCVCVELGVQHHHPRHPSLQTHPAYCASPQTSVDHKLPDRQEAAGEAGEHHIQHPDNQHWRPPGVCALPTALLPLHQYLGRPVC